MESKADSRLTGNPLCVGLYHRGPGPFDLQHFLGHPADPIYELFALGGNHTRMAKSLLGQKYPDEVLFKTHQCMLYLNLEDNEARELGLQHQVSLSHGFLCIFNPIRVRV